MGSRTSSRYHVKIVTEPPFKRHKVSRDLTKSLPHRHNAPTECVMFGDVLGLRLHVPCYFTLSLYACHLAPEQS
ncbi:hypothetical protein TNCV_3118371 [Trichonephila clavipes]|uniref:Uncharacterized protein n=1 Tax=Trichonephila clavipes TaxID=2585209 RepID=A0A8X7BHL7_TRICX|nr:hypothetical protein TNCV_3118371 [Trichonephila clavipes]